jgi:ferredoxin
MDNTSCIYWFSGTGNSLYAAKRLSEELGNTQLAQITDDPPPTAVGGTGRKVGFVFPSYFCNLPRAVHAFVEKLEIKPGTYIFAIVTMGAFGQGSVAAMSKVLKAKGLRLNYGRGVHMPANNVLLYNPADPGKSGKTLEKTDAALRQFAAEIKARIQKVKSHPFILRTHFKNIETLDTGFTAGDSCTGCGLCEKICPVRNIRIESGKPQWLHRCELCVACICWCPARAIENGGKTKSRRRYRNPNVTADDLTRKEPGE